jgi:hypothetical protein
VSRWAIAAAAILTTGGSTYQTCHIVRGKNAAALLKKLDGHFR